MANPLDKVELHPAFYTDKKKESVKIEPNMHGYDHLSKAEYEKVKAKKMREMSTGKKETQKQTNDLKSEVIVAWLPSDAYKLALKALNLSEPINSTFTKKLTEYQESQWISVDKKTPMVWPETYREMKAWEIFEIHKEWKEISEKTQKEILSIIKLWNTEWKNYQILLKYSLSFINQYKDEPKYKTLSEWLSVSIQNNTFVNDPTNQKALWIKDEYWNSFWSDLYDWLFRDKKLSEVFNEKRRWQLKWFAIFALVLWAIFWKPEKIFWNIPLMKDWYTRIPMLIWFFALWWDDFVWKSIDAWMSLFDWDKNPWVNFSNNITKKIKEWTWNTEADKWLYVLKWKLWILNEAKWPDKLKWDRIHTLLGVFVWNEKLLKTKVTDLGSVNVIVGSPFLTEWEQKTLKDGWVTKEDLVKFTKLLQKERDISNGNQTLGDLIKANIPKVNPVVVAQPAISTWPKGKIDADSREKINEIQTFELWKDTTFWNTIENELKTKNLEDSITYLQWLLVSNPTIDNEIKNKINSIISNYVNEISRLETKKENEQILKKYLSELKKIDIKDSTSINSIDNQLEFLKKTNDSFILEATDSSYIKFNEFTTKFNTIKWELIKKGAKLEWSAWGKYTLLIEKEKLIESNIKLAKELVTKFSINRTWKTTDQIIGEWKTILTAYFTSLKTKEAEISWLTNSTSSNILTIRWFLESKKLDNYKSIAAKLWLTWLEVKATDLIVKLNSKIVELKKIEELDKVKNNINIFNIYLDNSPSIILNDWWNKLLEEYVKYKNITSDTTLVSSLSIPLVFTEVNTKVINLQNVLKTNKSSLLTKLSGSTDINDFEKIKKLYKDFVWIDIHNDLMSIPFYMNNNSETLSLRKVGTFTEISKVKAFILSNFILKDKIIDVILQWKVGQIDEIRSIFDSIIDINVKNTILDMKISDFLTSPTASSKLPRELTELKSKIQSLKDLIPWIPAVTPTVTASGTPAITPTVTPTGTLDLNNNVRDNWSYNPMIKHKWKLYRTSWMYDNMGLDTATNNTTITRDNSGNLIFTIKPNWMFDKHMRSETVIINEQTFLNNLENWDLSDIYNDEWFYIHIVNNN